MPLLARTGRNNQERLKQNLPTNLPTKNHLCQAQQKAVRMPRVLRDSLEK